MSGAPWDLGEEIAPLPAGLARDVLERIGVAGCASSLEGLGRLYRAWGHHLGMENLSKRLGLLRAADPSGAATAPEQTLASFLERGTSGTCWPTMEAFVALARAAGFDARPRLGEMTEPGRLDHGATVVVLGGTTYSVDQNLLWPAPLPLDREQATRVLGPHYAAEARYERERSGFRIRRLRDGEELRPTFLHEREAGRADYAPSWRRSLAQSYFNQGYFANRVRDGCWRQLDTSRFREIGPEGEVVGAPADDLPAFVSAKFGVSAALVAELLEAERAAGLRPASSVPAPLEG